LDAATGGALVIAAFCGAAVAGSALIFVAGFPAALAGDALPAETADLMAGADAFGAFSASMTTGLGATGLVTTPALTGAEVLTAGALAAGAFATAALADFSNNALGASDFFTLLVVADAAAARSFAAGAGVEAVDLLAAGLADLTAEALTTEALTADVLAITDLPTALVRPELLVLDAAPARDLLSDDFAVEGILWHSLSHPALETGQAVIHPAVNGSETSARTCVARRPAWPIKRPRSQIPQKKPRTLQKNSPGEAGPTWGKHTPLARMDLREAEKMP
jgi:hypothetical protein